MNSKRTSQVDKANYMIDGVCFTLILCHRFKWMFLSVLSVQDGNTSDGFINCGGGEKFIGCFFPRQVNFVSSRCVKMGRYSVLLLKCDTQLNGTTVQYSKRNYRTLAMTIYVLLQLWKGGRIGPADLEAVEPKLQKLTIQNFCCWLY